MREHFRLNYLEYDEIYDANLRFEEQKTDLNLDNLVMKRFG